MPDYEAERRIRAMTERTAMDKAGEVKRIREAVSFGETQIAGKWFVKDLALLLEIIDALTAERDAKDATIKVLTMVRDGIIADRDAARATVEAQAKELAKATANNHDRNLALDAHHFVWCDGGCSGGIHRFGEHPPLTAEIVAAAERNTRRLRSWYVNKAGRSEVGTTEARIPSWRQADHDIHEAYVRQSEQERDALCAEVERLKRGLEPSKKSLYETIEDLDRQLKECVESRLDDIKQLAEARAECGKRLDETEARYGELDGMFHESARMYTAEVEKRRALEARLALIEKEKS